MKKHIIWAVTFVIVTCIVFNALVDEEKEITKRHDTKAQCEDALGLKPSNYMWK